MQALGILGGGIWHRSRTASGTVEEPAQRSFGKPHDKPVWRIKFGRSELVMDEKGMITDITFNRESVFPQGQPSCCLRLFKDREPAAVQSVALEGDCLVYRFEHMEDICNCTVYLPEMLINTAFFKCI